MSVSSSGDSGATASGRLPVHSTLPVIFGVALATGFSGAVMPGPLLAVVVRETMRVGWSAGPIMMIGHGMLELVAVALLAMGLIRFARSARAQGLIGLVGGAVLLFLGYQTLVMPAEVGGALGAGAAEAVGGGTWARLIGLGTLMSVANPYWWLWWATIGVAHSQWAIRRGRAGASTYYIGHISSDVIWYSAVSIALAAGRTLFSPGVLRVTYVVCAVFLLALGVVFGAAGVKALRGGAARAG